MTDAARVLVCDDEPQILRALRVILREAGYEAVLAETGEEALDAAAVQPPQAAILDLMLPDIDGVEVTKRLREWSEMPIVVLSAVGEEDAKVRALAAGGADVNALENSRYDVITIWEAPNDEAMAKLAAATGSLGNVTTETLRLFTEDEFRKLIADLP